jgi:hypothetical protein
MKYKVKKVAHRKGHWVEVSSTEEPTFHVVMGLHAIMTEKNMLEIAEWVIENQLGSRQSFNQWKLINESAVLAFALKWS